MALQGDQSHMADMNAETLIDPVSDVLRDVAAEFIMPRWQKLSASDISQKTSPTDLVTVADREAELALTPKLMALVPGSVVVGEEAVGADKGILDRLLKDDPVWLVDPVDGTLNFVEGSDQFAVMVALVKRGETQAGWIYSPVDGRMATSFVGGGVTVEGKRLPRRHVPTFSDATGEFSKRFFDEHVGEVIADRLARANATQSTRCSAHAYLNAVTGRLDFLIQWFMSPWDHAAGSLMLQEVGGVSRFIDDGSTYTPMPRSPRALLSVAEAEQWDMYREEFL